MELIEQAARWQSPETIPVSANILPAAWIHYGAELQKLVDNYPQFFHGRKTDYEHPETLYSGTYVAGEHVDEWGCVWSNLVNGMEAIVTGHPIKSIQDIYDLKIPENRDGRLPHGFMYLRLLDLCGFENAMMLFAEEEEPLRILIEKVVQYNKYQIEAVLPRVGSMMGFGDDLGMQKGLAIGPAKWRKYIKPCFAELYGMVKAAKPDIVIYMHTDGCIYEIMPDLVECGVDMINPQYRANGLENLVRVCRKEHKIAINLDLDRQLFPFANRGQLFDHVGSCVEALYDKQGGLGISMEFNYDIPLENMASLLDAAEKYRHYRG